VGDLGQRQGFLHGHGLVDGFLPLAFGSESATMPAPARTVIVPSCTQAVRMVMARSMLPLKEM
jgi:hypothetical protein